MIKKLTDSEQGEFLIHTESGTVYLLELLGEKSGGFITRSPKAPVDERAMRKDNARLPLVHINKCAVGEYGSFMLVGVSEHPEVITLRETTVISKIVDVTP